MEKLLKGTKKLSQIITNASQNDERFILYGDADLDGIASVIIFKEMLEILNQDYKTKNEPIVYFPDREKDGYGITSTAIKKLKKFSPAVFVALDCGITNFDEVKELKKQGFLVVIIDHHKIIGKLPKAEVIVDPKQKGEKYPFKKFSAAGVTYKISKYILESNYLEWSPDSFLELVALATLADQMPQEEENKELIQQGLMAFKYTKRTGLLALKEVTGYKEDLMSDLYQKIIAPLNSSDRINDLTESYILLTTKSKKQAQAIAKDLYRKSIEKKEKIQKMFEEVERRISGNEVIIYEGDKNWLTVMMGIVASKICQKYKKPTFLFKYTKDEAICSARLPKGFDGVKAMQHCQDLLISFGGHAPACGCRLKKENLEKFKSCLVNYFLKKQNE
ncbi:DHH family phosphoesterase [bacterium]|nr:DHH family phosphoesterase [bacterium]